MAAEQSLAEAVSWDLKRMHETWMEFIYPRQRGAEQTVLGKWKPQGGLSLYLYLAWSYIGAPLIGLLYPFVLLGYVFRYQTRRLGATAVRLGIVTVLGLLVALWGGLSLLATFQLSMDANGVVAVVAASGVAVVSAALSFLFWRVGGRLTTVLFAYPFAMTALFLPPVVAGLYSEALGSVVLSGTDSLQDWLLANGPALVDGVKAYLVDTFDLEGGTYVLLWFGISVPLGWLVGIVVTMADLVRPTAE